jgi:hypothetical protein
MMKLKHQSLFYTQGRHYYTACEKRHKDILGYVLGEKYPVEGINSSFLSYCTKRSALILLHV